MVGSDNLRRSVLCPCLERLWKSKNNFVRVSITDSVFSHRMVPAGLKPVRILMTSVLSNGLFTYTYGRAPI
jgi:hypothetical protein